MASIALALHQGLLLAKQHFLLIVFVLIAFRLLRNKFKPTLSKIPGPPLAAYSQLWRLYYVWRGSAHLDAIELHRKYGNLVRIGPNHVSIADPHWIPIIYGSKENYLKTGFYPLHSISWKKQPGLNLFSTRDPQYHRVEKRKVGNAYSLPRVLESEGAIDSCIAVLLSQLDGFVSREQPVDLGVWLQYLAFDVVGEVTFASKFGFLEQGKDVDGMMEAIKGMLVYLSLCGQVPEMHRFLLGNPLFIMVMPAMETWNQVLVFTLKAINNRATIKRDGELIDADTDGRDMLSRWAYVKRSDPDKMSTRDIVVHLSANVFAGSDTTGIALRAIIYFLCQNPLCKKKLIDEIDAAEQARKLSHPITYKEASGMPYAQAVLKESLRLHSSIGLLMERHVPPSGVEIDGHMLKGGTIVGINPWVTNHNRDIFPDPTSFKPERWIEASESELKVMDSVWELNFGAGARKCTGRHISWRTQIDPDQPLGIEMTKVIPELFRRYTVDLAEPGQEWRVLNRWFTQQEGVICTLHRRK